MTPLLSYLATLGIDQQPGSPAAPLQRWPKLTLFLADENAFLLEGKSVCRQGGVALFRAIWESGDVCAPEPLVTLADIDPAELDVSTRMDVGEYVPKVYGIGALEMLGFGEHGDAESVKQGDTAAPIPSVTQVITAEGSKGSPATPAAQTPEPPSRIAAFINNVMTVKREAAATAPPPPGKPAKPAALGHKARKGEIPGDKPQPDAEIEFLASLIPATPAPDVTGEGYAHPLPPPPEPQPLTPLESAFGDAAVAELQAKSSKRSHKRKK